MAVTLRILGVLLLLPAWTNAQRIEFYEADAAKGGLVGSLPSDSTTTLDLKASKDWDNDEIRSIRLRWALPGTIIRLFDAPNGGTDDDWCKIVVKECVREVVIEHLQINQKTDTFEQTFHPKDRNSHSRNQLNGKVSRIELVAGRADKVPMVARCGIAIERAFPFNEKNGAAHLEKAQGSQYRLYYPDLSVERGDGVVVSFKMNHVRSGLQDDRAAVTVIFDSAGEVADIEVSVRFGKEGERWSKAAEDFGKPIKEFTDPVAELMDAAEKAIAAMTDHGGREYFSTYIRHTTNNLRTAIREAIGK